VSRFRSAVHLVVSIPRSIIGNYSIIQKPSSLFCHPLDHTQLLRFAVPNSQLSGTGFERCAQPELRRSCLIRSAPQPGPSCSLMSRDHVRHRNGLFQPWDLNSPSFSAHDPSGQNSALRTMNTSTLSAGREDPGVQREKKKGIVRGTKTSPGSRSGSDSHSHSVSSLDLLTHARLRTILQ